MIRVTCQCGSRGQVPDTHAGKQIKCRKCGSMIAVPPQEPLIESAPEPLIQSAPKQRRSASSTSRFAVIAVTIGICAMFGVCASFCAKGPRSPRQDYVDLKGNIEGTKWRGRDSEWELEFSQYGRLTLTRPIRDGLSLHRTGKYTLSGTSAVTFYLDDAIDGKKVFTVDIYIRGDELSFRDVDGSTVEFVRAK
jgi:hypothetical protein